MLLFALSETSSDIFPKMVIFKCFQKSLFFRYKYKLNMSCYFLQPAECEEIVLELPFSKDPIKLFNCYKMSQHNVGPAKFEHARF